MENKLDQLFQKKQSNILNIYFTAGFPNLNDTAKVILELEKAGADLIEIGMPYSDPMADGPTIQESGQVALDNGMNLNLLFDQINSIKGKTNTPLICMGYLNQVMQFGEKKFIQKCKETGVDGLILPDLPLDIYESDYKNLFEENDIKICFLITPQTSDERIKEIDRLSSGFIYVVADSSITGNATGISPKQIEYFERINAMNLNSNKLIGFGISDAQSFKTACQYSNGAIIGSAFIRALKNKEHGLTDNISNFIGSILNEKLINSPLKK